MEEEILLKLKKDCLNVNNILVISILLIIALIILLLYLLIIREDLFLMFFVILFLFLFGQIFNALNTDLIITNKFIKARNLSTLYKYEKIFYNDIQHIEIIKTYRRSVSFGRLKIYYSENKIIDIGAFGLYEEFKEEILSIVDFLRRREGYNLIVKVNVPDTGWGI